MKYGIIADSCCDITPQLQQKLETKLVPLTMRLGGAEYLDDENLDIGDFMLAMKKCNDKVGSAAPPPSQYQQAMEGFGDSFAITLSSRLSGSYESAMAGKCMAEENGAQVHVFDSKSASAGEVLIAIKLHELIQSGMSKTGIIEKTNKFINNMKTYFVLENYDNLQKNGRLSKVTSKLVRILNINLVMGSDGDGSIMLYTKTRGIKKMLDKMLSFIESSGKDTQDENLVITHCNNPELANRLCEAVKQRFSFKEIFIVPTRGLSSLYADDKGIIMAF